VVIVALEPVVFIGNAPVAIIGRHTLLGEAREWHLAVPQCNLIKSSSSYRVMMIDIEDELEIN
jgi:hypothetical protein